MAQDTGTPQYGDHCQELLIRTEHDLIFAVDHVREAMGAADPLTEFSLRQISTELNQVYSRVLGLRTARNAHHAG